MSWPSQIEIDEISRSGWKSTPFQLFLLKVHGRCNLDCSYCYVYHHPDQSWRDKPRQMTPTVMEAAAGRIREHAQQHGLQHVSIGLHGGEPLLLGAQRLDELLRIMKDTLGAGVSFDLSLQTNGVLLTPELADLCLSWRIRIGVSLDGDRATNDLSRIYHDGRSSYDDVIRALDLLRQPQYREIYAGILATIQLPSDPVRVFRLLASLSPSGIDFLLPHGTWESPPPGKHVHCTDHPYADWLIRVFEDWYPARPKVCGIRLFDEIIHVLLGGRTDFESIGLSPVNLIVVETDGSIEGVDTLKASFAGAPATGFNIHEHDFDTVLMHPGIVARQIGRFALSDECQRCDLVEICGGGYFPHRYHPESGFRTRSVFCADLMKLIRHIRARLEHDLRELIATSAQSPA